MRSNIIDKIKTYSDLLVLPHSVFALPFALASFFEATQGHPSIKLLILVILAVVLARTAGMAYNRLVDVDLDHLNPRTKFRPLQTGKISIFQVKMLIVISSFMFILVCWKINGLALELSPVALGILFFYSHTKRFTWVCHFFLGLSLGMAPVGAWIAATSHWSEKPFWLMAAVICFVAGFDILYALQDEFYDRQTKIYSWVVRWGRLKSLKTAAFLHLMMLLFLVGFGIVVHFPWEYNIGIFLIGFILFFQYGITFKQKKEGRFSIHPAFMKLNGVVSMIYFLIVGVSLWH